MGLELPINRVNAGRIEFEYSVPQPTIGLFSNHRLDPTDASWDIDVPQSEIAKQGDYSVNASTSSWVFQIPEPTVAKAGQYDLDVGDTEWQFEVPQPSIESHTENTINPASADWLFEIPQPDVLNTHDHAVNAGDVAWMVNVVNPTAGVFSHFAVDVEDTDWEVAVPQPQIRHTLGQHISPATVSWSFETPEAVIAKQGDYEVDAGNVDWIIHVPEQTFEALDEEIAIKDFDQDFKTFIPSNLYFPTVQGRNELFTAISAVLDITDKNYYSSELDAVLDSFNPRGDSFNIDCLFNVVDSLGYGNRFFRNRVKPEALAHILPRIYELKGTRQGLELILALAGIDLETFVGWRILRDHRRYGDEGVARFKELFSSVDIDSIKACDTYFNITTLGAAFLSSQAGQQIDEIISGIVTDFVWTCVDINIFLEGGVTDTLGLNIVNSEPEQEVHFHQKIVDSHLSANVVPSGAVERVLLSSPI